jgi:hypothetical protein
LSNLASYRGKKAKLFPVEMDEKANDGKQAEDERERERTSLQRLHHLRSLLPCLFAIICGGVTFAKKVVDDLFIDFRSPFRLDRSNSYQKRRRRVRQTMTGDFQTS